MAKTVYSSGYEGGPEKIVIVAGPSFGQAVKFMLFGAAIGAGAQHFFSKSKVAALRPAPANPLGFVGSALVGLVKSRVGSSKPSQSEALKDVAAKYEATVEDFSTEVASGTLKEAPTSTEDIADRIGSLTARLKSLGSRAKNLVETAGEAVKPTLESALAEGKKAASEVQTRLKKDVDEAGDRPAIAEQDGELPSEKEDKFIE